MSAIKKMFTGSCEFVAGAMVADALPAMTLPEIAFAGKSNVGKSSLINTITSRKALARTSQTPGRTRQLNFFNIADKFILVDLPGYGYAKASKKDIAAWTKLTRQYLCGRANLRRVCLLIDARRGITEADDNYMKMFDDAAVSYQIILTKCDKTKNEELQKTIDSLEPIMKKHPACMPQIINSSSMKNIGIDELRKELIDIL